MNEQALEQACIAKIANGSSAGVWRDHWAWIVANAPEDAANIRDGVRTAVEAYLAALPTDEGAFTAALHDYAERCYINATNNANEAMIGEERDLKQAVLSLYRQAKGGA